MTPHSENLKIGKTSVLNYELHSKKLWKINTTNVKLQLYVATQALCRCWCSKTPAVSAVMCGSLGDGARLDPRLLQVFEVLLNNISIRHLVIY